MNYQFHGHFGGGHSPVGPLQNGLSVYQPVFVPSILNLNGAPQLWI
jgi:hypothetical protein